MTEWLDEIRTDVTFALRQMRRAPVFSVVAVATLALGIGVNSAIFALADAALLRPLPFRDSDRLVAVWEKFQRFDRTAVAPLNFHDWDERNRSFESMAAVFGYPRQLTGSDGTAEQVPAQQVTPRFFEVLGVQAIAGRTFLPSDVALPPNVAIISESLWNTHFGREPKTIGRVVRVDGQPFTILGVVPDIDATGASQMWTVFVELPGMDARGLHFMRVIGRLKPGVSQAVAQSDLDAVAAQLAVELPETNKGRGVAVDPLRRALIGPEIRLTALLLLGVVGFVLLMCCGNLASLLLARMTGRAREIAIRSSLGAGRRRIIAQILTESVVLAAMGGTLGMVTGAAILRAAPSLIPDGLLPPTIPLTFDGRVLLFCVAAALFVGILFGVAPAWQASGVTLTDALAADNRTATRASGALRRALVVGEVALAVLLLCGAGLLLRTLLAVDSVDAGYRADNALTMQVQLSYGLPSSRYKNEQQLLQFYQRVEREVAALPDVSSAGWSGSVPLGGTFVGDARFDIVGRPSTANARPTAEYQLVTPSYFGTLDIPLLAGRAFDDRDTATSPEVCIVSDTFARKYFGGASPLGARLAIPLLALRPSTPIEREIVGVVAHVKARPDTPDDAAEVYVPMAQNTWSNAVLSVRGRSGSPAQLAPSVRAAIARVDRDQPVTRVMTLDQVARQATARQRFRAMLVMTFAGLGLLLAMVGVFGVLAYTVQQRTREFGVRIALGATTGDVLAIVLANITRIIAAGAAIGLVAAALLGRALSTFLFGVRPLDPLTFVGVVAVTVATATVAVAVPAMRAGRTDPLIALRSE